MRLWCEVCDSDDGCECPPCSCIWCRDTRGEHLDPLERARVNRHNAELARHELRQSAERMAAKIAGEAP
jgi:hypothetical protein